MHSTIDEKIFRWEFRFSIDSLLKCLLYIGSFFPDCHQKIIRREIVDMFTMNKYINK